MTIMRWDAVNSTANRINGLPSASTITAATGGPYRSTRNRFTPGVQFLIHANIKASFEYQIQPQFVVFNPNPATGLPVPNIFRTNAAVTALEWVY